MKELKDMTLEELGAVIKADFERFCDGCDEDTSAEVLAVLDEIARRSEPCTPPPMEALIDVKTMTDEELNAIWNEVLYTPIDEPIPELVVDVLRELAYREDKYLAIIEKEYLANLEKEGDPQ